MTPEIAVACDRADRAIGLARRLRAAGGMEPTGALALLVEGVIAAAEVGEHYQAQLTRSLDQVRASCEELRGAARAADAARRLVADKLEAAEGVVAVARDVVAHGVSLEHLSRALRALDEVDAARPQT